MSLRRITAASLLAMLALAGCSATKKGAPSPSESSSSPPAPASSTGPVPQLSSSASKPPVSPSTQPSEDAAHQALAAMDEAHRVGQLFMAGASSYDGVRQDTATAITDYHVGSVILTDNARTSAAAVHDLATSLQQMSGAPKLFVSSDQEGGQVQRLQGDGFSTIPDALQQGQLSPAALQQAAAGWGRELAAAGVNLDLAPVTDTVPSAAAAQNNPPIGQLQREFGYDPQTVGTHSAAFVRGLVQSGVATSAKHFPGLGRVTGNTDLSAGVTDSTTTRNDPYVQAFADPIKAGTPFVMMSTAIYSRIDPGQPAAFSATIIGSMLRGDLGFHGVVISDDLGGAVQVSSYAVGDRAVNFIAAGGDMVLTVDASQIPTMTQAVLQRANIDPAFKAKVDAAALRVLQAKAAFHLL